MRLAVLALLFLGCQPQVKDPWADNGRKMACLDLRDHMVEMHVDAYLKRGDAHMSLDRRKSLQAEWGREMAHVGTFDHFERSCFSGLTVERYKCAMQAPSADDMAACMK